MPDRHITSDPNWQVAQVRAHSTRRFQQLRRLIETAPPLSEAHTRLLTTLLETRDLLPERQP
jgi:hypothetical protein